MPISKLLDNDLLRALRDGAGALPEDLAQLARCLHTIEMLLAEKAVETEPTWDMALDTAAEVETLQGLEDAVAERLIGFRAGCLDSVMKKIELWRLLSGTTEERGSPADRLIRSLQDDLVRVAKRQKV